MPRSITKSVVTDFEPRRKNPIELGFDSNLDKDFKPLIIGDIATNLLFSFDSEDGSGNTYVQGKLESELIKTNELETLSINTGKLNGDLEFYMYGGFNLFTMSASSSLPYIKLISVLDSNDWAQIESISYNGSLKLQTIEGASDGGVSANIQLVSNGNTSITVGKNSSSYGVAADVISFNTGNGVFGKMIMSVEDEWNLRADDNLKLEAQDGDVKIDPSTGITRFLLDGDTDDLCTLTVAANGATTIATADSDGIAGNLILDIDGDIELNADGGQVKITDDTVTHFMFNCDTTRMVIYDDTDTSDYLSISVAANGVSTILTNDNDGAVGHLTLAPDGDLILEPVSQKTIINATDKLYFDGGTDTYIHEVSDDKIQFIVGDDGDIMLQLEEKGADGNEVSFGSSCVGFTQLEPTYDATNTNVDFRHSNKQFLTFGSGNITNLNVYFPLVSGNFVLLVKQDGTGSRTITNYKVFEFDESSADGSYPVKFAGGSAPTLTTDANHVDILSFYWDADNEIAYGVATLDFQF